MGKPKARKQVTPAPELPPPAETPAPRVWRPRPYQLEPMNAIRQGIRRVLAIWHRRGGKDRTTLQLEADEMREHVGNYWHLYPKLTQAKKAIWNGVDPATGQRFIDELFPLEHRDYTNEQDMFIRMDNGSTWQLAGSDNYDRLVGSNVLGCGFSEWALSDPAAWEYIRPILAENGGWAFFNSTYRGRNHCYQMAKALADNPDWFISVRGAQQGGKFIYPELRTTTREDGSPVISYEAIAKEVRDGMSEALARQEFYCDPMAAQPGAMYGATMQTLLEQRSGRHLHDATYPVYAAWNLDNAPSNYSVVFFQERGGNELAVIGSRSWMFEPLHNCFADLATFPWRAARDLIMFDKEGVWASLFDSHQRKPELVFPLDQGRVSAITNAMLTRTHIDTMPRSYAGKGIATNNELLVDSLLGYRVRALETGTERENFDHKPLVTYERYLAGAAELFATWQFTRDPKRGRSRRSQYGVNGRELSAYDRTVI